MWMVRMALRRPIGVVVAVFALVLGAGLALLRVPEDIFPNLDVPVIYVAQPYVGMAPDQMEGQFVQYYEYHFLYATGVEHIESQSIQGLGLLKLYFHPGTDMGQALSHRWRCVIFFVCNDASCVPKRRAIAPPHMA